MADLDHRVRKELPTDFRKLYDPTVSNDAKDVSRIFELDIKYENQTLSKIDSYLMQHTMTSSCGDRELDIWAREQKLFPWVAIAAPLVHFAGKGSFSGGLFSTLRLPPNTGQPVHIHGLFAIPPDRGNLDRKAEAVQWNQLLFENRVAAAWSQLLLYRNCISWNAEGFGLWPRADLSDTSLWAKLDAWVIDIVLKENLPVWNAISGCCVELTQGLFTKNDAESAEYKPALAQIQLPAVILEEALLNKLEKGVACQAKELNRMTPSAVSEFLREQCPSDLPEDISSSLLEYCLLDAIKSDLKGTPRTYLYENLHDLQLWPTMDGKLSVSGDLLLPRDRAEMRLFSGSNTTTFKTVDLDGLTAKIQDLLLKDITYLRGITRFRSLLDLAIDWPDMYAVASESEHLGGLSQRSDELNPLLRDIWVWICRRFKEEKGKIPTSLYDLWLIPINNGRIRRFGPGKYSCPTLILEKREPMADIILASATRDAILTPPLLDSISLTADSVKFLRKSANTVPELRFACQDQLDTFLEWLVVGREMLAAASTESIKALLKHLENLLRDQSHTKASSSELGSQMRKLPLFSKTVPAAPSEYVLLFPHLLLFANGFHGTGNELL